MITKKAIKNALELEKVVNEILSDAVLAKEHIDGAINWADLSVSDVYISAKYPGALTVEIEEVAPDNRILQEYITERLQQAGHKDIGISFQW